MFRLKIDVREKKLIECLSASSSSSNIEISQLAVGDMVIESASLKLIFERKTLTDLSSSIRDGRYKEQSHRLNGIADHHNHNTVYLIEGNMYKMGVPSEKERLYSTLFSLQFYKGFSVVRTGSVEETAFWLLNAMKKLEREPTKPLFYHMQTTSIEGGGGGGPQSTDDDHHPVEQCRKKIKCERSYTEMVKTVKKQNITSENIDACMLCQIPDVSGKIADAIMHEFGSLLVLKTRLEEDKTCLDTFTLNNRKIGKNVVQNLIKFLHVS